VGKGAGKGGREGGATRGPNDGGRAAQPLPRRSVDALGRGSRRSRKGTPARSAAVNPVVSLGRSTAAESRERKGAADGQTARYGRASEQAAGTLSRRWRKEREKEEEEREGGEAR